MWKRKSGGERLLIFLHIQRTGGTTLSSIIRRQYDPAVVYHKAHVATFPYRQLTALPKLMPKGTEVVLGRMEFGLHALLQREARYVTILRDPIDRVISYYYLITSRPDHPFFERLRAEGISLRQYASSGRFMEANDLQTRLLSGWGSRPGRCPDGMLSLAKRNLEEHFAVVGVMERYDETLMLLKRTFGWRAVLYCKENAGPVRPPRASLDESTVRALEETNQLDAELYRYAKGRLDEAISRQSFDFEIEVEALKRVNEAYAAQRAHQL